MSLDMRSPCVFAESPRSLAKKIESCVVRNALDEERRAQKALYLLKSRDERIAFLEKRVSELEETAANIHAISLRASSTLSSLDPEERDTFVSATHSERSSRTHEEQRHANYDDRSSSFDREPKVPNLRLPKSITSTSERELFSTAVLDCISRNTTSTAVKNCKATTTKSMHSRDTQDPLAPSTDRTSNEESSEKSFNREANEKCENVAAQWTARTSEEEEEGKVSQNLANGRTTSEIRTEDSGKTQVLLEARNWKSDSSSKISGMNVRWIRSKRNLRQRIRPFAAKPKRWRTSEEERVDVASFRTIEATSPATSLPANLAVAPTSRPKSSEKKTEKTEKTEKTVKREKREKRDETMTKEGRFGTVEQDNTERRTTSTQTNDFKIFRNSKQLDNRQDTNVSRSTPSLHTTNKKFSTSRIFTEDPVPQWLIEEALNRGAEEWQLNLESANKNVEYESVICDLEEKLIVTRAELEKAIERKNAVKEKYKRIFHNAKVAACKENEALQEKIVQICTSFLDKFGPYTMSTVKGSKCQIGKHRSNGLKKLSYRLHKKLRIAAKTTNKLKRELNKTKTALEEKSQKFDSMNKCFAKLKENMEKTEINLNRVITENTSLRENLEGMKEWLELKTGKGQNEKSSNAQIRDLQKCKEMTNLKKKVEEDFATITQLHKKLLRSESANTHKSCLLNNYKIQLADLAKEKEEFLSKIKTLENEVSMLRNSNAQLKAKIFLQNEEKEKLLVDVGKSETDLKQKMEPELNRKYEEWKQEEIDAIKTTYEEKLQILQNKANTLENQNAEYFKAIKEFLRKVHEHFELEEKRNLSEQEAGEREAHETACNILNMTPQQLSNLMTGKSFSTIDSWFSDLSKMTIRSNFSDGLAKFLFKKTISKIDV